MKIGIIGCAGRMGRTLLKEVISTDGCTLSGGVDHEKSNYLGKDIGSLIHEDTLGICVTDDKDALIFESDAIIDFTTPASSLACAEIASKHGTTHIIGTTGLSGEEQNKLAEYAKHTPIVFAPNMSIGVNLLLSLVEQVASTLDEEYDIEVLEMHHRNKVDSPSGTALALGRAAADGRNIALADVSCRSRDGHTGVRPSGEIGFATMRGGDVIGDHTVMFAGSGERIEITHKASDRSIYSRGAVRAAIWAKQQNPGRLYSMKDVLNLK